MKMLQIWLLLLLTGCTQGECAAPLVLVTNDVAYTNRTLQINPTPTGWALGGTVITQWSDGNTNQIALGNFSWPQTNFVVLWQRQPGTNRYGAIFWAMAASNDVPQWSSMASVSFVCDGYELTASTGPCRFQAKSSLSQPWQTYSLPSPVIGGYDGSQFFRLATGTKMAFLRDSLPRYFQVVTTNTQTQVAAVVPKPPMPN